MGDISDSRNACNWVVRSSKKSWLVKEVEWKLEHGAYVSGVSAGRRYAQTCFDIHGQKLKQSVVMTRGVG